MKSDKETLNNVLKSIENEYGLEAMLNANNLKIWLTDYSDVIDQNVETKILKCVSDESISSVDEIIAAVFPEPKIKSSSGSNTESLFEKTALKQCLTSIEKDRGFAILCDSESMKILFTDYKDQLNDSTIDRYLKVIGTGKEYNSIKAIVDEVFPQTKTDETKKAVCSNKSSKSEDTTKIISSKYTRFEKARIIGARALQISYGAPVLVDYPDDMLDPIDIAMLEFDKDIIPITVVRS